MPSAGRIITGVATGGLSEVARAGFKAMTPKIPTLPTRPTRGSGSVLKEKEKVKRALTGRSGRSATILTGGQGLGDNSISSGLKNTLG